MALPCIAKQGAQRSMFCFATASRPTTVEAVAENKLCIQSPHYVFARYVDGALPAPPRHREGSSGGERKAIAAYINSTDESQE